MNTKIPFKDYAGEWTFYTEGETRRMMGKRWTIDFMASKATHRIIIYRDRKRQWRFTIVHRNRKIIAVSSESYRRRSACELAISGFITACFTSKTITIVEDWVDTDPLALKRGLNKSLKWTKLAWATL